MKKLETKTQLYLRARIESFQGFKIPGAKIANSKKLCSTLFFPLLSSDDTIKGHCICSNLDAATLTVALNDTALHVL